MEGIGMDLTGAVFFKSSKSGQDGACVEVAKNLPGVVAVRDSKDQDGPVLTFTPGAWADFTAGIRDGDF